MGDEYAATIFTPKVGSWNFSPKVGQKHGDLPTNKVGNFVDLPKCIQSSLQMGDEYAATIFRDTDSGTRVPVVIQPFF